MSTLTGVPVDEMVEMLKQLGWHVTLEVSNAGPGAVWAEYIADKDGTVVQSSSSDISAARAMLVRDVLEVEGRK